MVIKPFFGAAFCMPYLEGCKVTTRQNPDISAKNDKFCTMFDGVSEV
jgi:hypothetical protein